MVRISEPDPKCRGRMFFRQMPLAHKWCVGRGIEFGAAAHNPFGLKDCKNYAPFSDDPNHPDARDFEFYKAHQKDMCGSYALVDKCVEADNTGEHESSIDYVISSHVIEHLPNLIGAFVEWQRIIKPGGIIFMIFPMRNALEQDKNREITPIGEFFDDYFRNLTYKDHPIHPGHGVRGHYHVFTVVSMLELIEQCNVTGYTRWNVVAVESTDSKVGNGHTVVCQKTN